MKISSRFSVAVHILAALQFPPNKNHNTSETLAHSVNTNPVCIRRIIGQLKKAGLVTTHPGVAGASLALPPEEITLYDIFDAVEVVDEDTLFSIHPNPNTRCIVGANIQNVLGDILHEAQLAMERVLKNVTLADVLGQIGSRA
ncbi:MAG: Rrf2 family transcriptional regulator [Bacillota bacterium]